MGGPSRDDQVADGGTGFDVIILGSGSAGLSAALVCAAAGLSTLIVEKSQRIGGTTAYSGAGIWIPANHHGLAAGTEDSPEDALVYIRACAPDGWKESEDKLWSSLAFNAPQALRFFEEHTPLEFSLLDQPDPYPDLPGGKSKGRMLTTVPIRKALAGPWANRLQRSVMPQILTLAEVKSADPLTGPYWKLLPLLPKIAFRFLTGRRAMGHALVVGLLSGFLAKGGRLQANTRAIRLVQNENCTITGVEVERAGRRRVLSAKLGVVIATGGFEWDPKLRKEYFPGSTDYLASPPENEGDGLRMAAQIGAQLAHMDQANLNGAIPGNPKFAKHGYGWFHHLSPATLVVNRMGHRFGNEYEQNFCAKLNHRNSDDALANLPAWLISDRSFLRRERIARWLGRRDPNWLRQSSTLGELATAIGVLDTELIATVDTFNQAASGEIVDPFGRSACSGQMAPILAKPFVAVRFNRSFMSTKGGPRTDEFARVLDTSGAVIEGLYCAGVAMANPIGSKAVGAGTTIGPNLTWGFIAGQHIVNRAKIRSTPR